MRRSDQPGWPAAPLTAVLTALLLTGCTDAGSSPDAAPSPVAPTSAGASLPPPVTAEAAGACPASPPDPDGPPAVPAPPTTETPGALVPDADPVEVLVCRYAPGREPALDGEVAQTSGLDRVRLDLASAPAATCTLPPGGAPHLARLRYADGELWLSGTPGHPCGGNGAHVTSVDVGSRLEAAYDLGGWPP